jgi:mediator of RNA polymerase II transcription subunit 17
MAESLPLPLRPSVVTNPIKDSLQVRIGQINKQKGAFRHVTEASLLKEIDHDGRGDSDVDMESEGEEDALKPEDRQSLVWKGREAMLRQIE